MTSFLVALMQVEKQGAHFFGVTITEQQAQAGIVVRVTSPAQSKFKVIYLKWKIFYLTILSIEAATESSTVLTFVL